MVTCDGSAREFVPAEVLARVFVKFFAVVVASAVSVADDFPCESRVLGSDQM